MLVSSSSQACADPSSVFIGMSHKCDAYVRCSGLDHKANLSSCNTSREVHDKRHREIATLVQAIQKLDSDHDSISSLSDNRQTKASPGSKFRHIRADSNTTDETVADDWEECQDLFNEDDTSPPPLPSTKENIHSKKAQRAERKLAKNQAKFSGITNEDVNRVDKALHPPQLDQVGLPGSTLDPLAHSAIEANIAFNPSTFKYSSLRQSVHTKRLLKNNGSAKIDEGDSQIREAANLAIILHRLGITTTVPHNPRERKSLLAKLHETIRYDLECVANEDRDTMMRMAGYWRYANRRTYNVMVRNNQLWDWTTGAKLEEVEEEEEEDDMSSLGDRFSELSTAATTPLVSHFPSPDIDSCSEDFDLAAGPALGVGRAGAVETYDGEKTPTRSTFTGAADTRHYQTPTRVIAASQTATPPSAALGPPPKIVNPWTCRPAPHRDTNNRFAPLEALLEEPDSSTDRAASVRPTAPVLQFRVTHIARNRSPIRKVVFPPRRRSRSPTKTRHQQRDVQNGGPRAGLPTHKLGKATNANGLSYAGILRRGLQ